jgi:isocitrate dehydrogenase kinase/phosphatase
MTDLPQEIAAAILEGFNERYQAFRISAAQAQHRFERADWPAVRNASLERIDEYDRRVHEAVHEIGGRFPAARVDESLWPQIKRAYIELLYDHHQAECAETFYNSVACRVLDRTYYRNDYIFWRPAVSTDFPDAAQPTYRPFHPATDGFRRTLREVITSFGLRLPFADVDRDIRLVVGALRRGYPGSRVRNPNFHLQVLSSLFYRHRAAYIVGRVINGNERQPFAIAIRHVPGGGALYVDALLLTSDQLGRLFNLARSYFTVDMEVPSAFVRFLRSVMPSHPAAELYTSVGLHKQGKTLFYRDLHEHLRHSTDEFVVAPGARGLVMMVFTLPSFPYVFKVIRDHFRPPKQTTRAEVRRKYVFVKQHDRVGRMADTLEYSDVAFPRARLSPEVLAELEATCGSLIERDGERIVIGHLYIERRMTPLDLFLRKADDAAAERTIREFGRAIRELAAADVFPGDILAKNFGVTRAGRVVFYDYDEMTTLTEVNFRRIPPSRDVADEMAAEPWYSVGPNDAFPEEWPPFMFASPRDRELFRALNADLLDADWWVERQAAIGRREGAEDLPYPEELRLGG